MEKKEYCEAQANDAYPEGCKCENNGGGCDWCHAVWASEAEWDDDQNPITGVGA